MTHEYDVKSTLRATYKIEPKQSQYLHAVFANKSALLQIRKDTHVYWFTIKLVARVAQTLQECTISFTKVGQLCGQSCLAICMQRVKEMNTE